MIECSQHVVRMVSDSDLDQARHEGWRSVAKRTSFPLSLVLVTPLSPMDRIINMAPSKQLIHLLWNQKFRGP